MNNKYMNCSLLPSILVQSEDEFKQRLYICEGAASMVHIDIADGSFVPNTSWADPEAIKTIETGVKYELHLMVEDPLSELKKWEKIEAVSRIVVHVESPTLDADSLGEFCKKNKWELFAGFKLDTNPTEHPQLNASGCLCMGIHKIGFSGQQIDLLALEQLILKIKKTYPATDSWKWEIDGGVHENNVVSLRKLGFTEFVEASEIFDAPNPVARIHEITKAIPEIC